MSPELAAFLIMVIFFITMAILVVDREYKFKDKQLEKVGRNWSSFR